MNIGQGLAVGAMALSLWMQQAHGGNLIVNGDFEDVAAGFVQPSANNGGTGDYGTFFNSIGPILEGTWHQDSLAGAWGSRLLKGDSFTIPGVQTTPGPNTGQQWLYLTEAGNAGSGVSQSVALATGTYELGFALSSWAVTGLGSGQARVEVRLTDGVHSLLSETFVASPLIWSEFQRTVEVTVPGSYELSFLVPTNLNFATLDSVYLTSPIPEPGSYVLLLAGLGLVGGFARRGRRCT